MPKHVIYRAVSDVANARYPMIKPIALTHSTAKPTETWPPYTSQYGLIGPFDWQTIIRRAKGVKGTAVIGYTYLGELVGAAHIQVKPDAIQLHHIESSKIYGPWTGQLAPLTMLAMKVASLQFVNPETNAALETQILDVVEGMDIKYMESAARVQLAASFDPNTRMLKFS